MNPDERRSNFFEGPTYPPKLTAEDLVSDVQYNLQTLTGIEDRLAKLEDSISRLGKDIRNVNINLTHEVFVLGPEKFA